MKNKQYTGWVKEFVKRAKRRNKKHAKIIDKSLKSVNKKR